MWAVNSQWKLSKGLLGTMWRHLKIGSKTLRNRTADSSGMGAEGTLPPPVAASTYPSEGEYPLGGMF